MTRLFFTDPIKALWMIKEFGVKFDNLSSKTVIGDYDVFVSDLLDTSLWIAGGKIYVCKESEPVFDRRPDDRTISVRTGEGRKKKFYGSTRGMDGLYFVLAEKIIMRDNKQFFLPEVEE